MINGIAEIDSYIPHGGGEQLPDRVVVHAMGEYILNDSGKPVHAVQFLTDYKLSAHVLVDKEGRIFRCRPDNLGAWHARGYNKNSLGIEFLVHGEHDYASFIDAIKYDYLSPAQLETGLAVVDYWLDKYHTTTLDRHSDLSPGRKVDPGDGFPWDEFRNSLGL